MRITRRSFIGTGMTAAVTAVGLSRAGTARAASKAGFRVGVTDWNLRMEGNPDAVALAKRIGFDGLQISLSSGPERTWVGNGVLDRFVAESKRVGLPIGSVCLNVLHKNYLKSDPAGRTRVVESIPMAKRVGVRVILLPFFGKGALETAAEMDHVGDVLREVAPEAEKAGVVLGLENTISARDNVRIMDRARSPAVKVYYDVGNSTNNGHKIIEEIRWLGRERICEVHIKDNPHYLGQGTIDFVAVVDALADIGFAEWAQLETDCPADDVPADMTRNLQYLRRLMAQRNERAA
jgi:L-ribulose-5-phosphate 3-epimerase